MGSSSSGFFGGVGVGGGADGSAESNALAPSSVNWQLSGGRDAIVVAAGQHMGSDDDFFATFLPDPGLMMGLSTKLVVPVSSASRRWASSSAVVVVVLGRVLPGGLGAAVRLLLLVVGPLVAFLSIEYPICLQAQISPIAKYSPASRTTVAPTSAANRAILAWSMA